MNANTPSFLDVSQRGLYASSSAPAQRFVGVIEFDQRVPGPPAAAASSASSLNTPGPGHPWYALRTEGQRYPLIGDQFPELYAFVGKTVVLEGKLDVTNDSVSGSTFTAILPARVQLSR